MERVDLDRIGHAERQRWRNGDEWDLRATKIAVGELADGRWYVRCYDGPVLPAARAYGPAHGEHYARGTARRWMRVFGGSWAEA